MNSMLRQCELGRSRTIQPQNPLCFFVSKDASIPFLQWNFSNPTEVKVVSLFRWSRSKCDFFFSSRNSITVFQRGSHKFPHSEPVGAALLLFCVFPPGLRLLPLQSKHLPAVISGRRPSSAPPPASVMFRASCVLGKQPNKLRHTLLSLYSAGPILWCHPASMAR